MHHISHIRHYEIRVFRNRVVHIAIPPLKVTKRNVPMKRKMQTTHKYGAKRFMVSRVKTIAVPYRCIPIKMRRIGSISKRRLNPVAKIIFKKQK